MSFLIIHRVYIYSVTNQEEIKTLPWGEVWDEYLARQNMVSDAIIFKEDRKYEKEILSSR